MTAEQREQTRWELEEGLSACGVPFTVDRHWGTVEVGDYAIWIWVTPAPYAVYGRDDVLPRWEFESLPALLAFLTNGVRQAA